MVDQGNFKIYMYSPRHTFKSHINTEQCTVEYSNIALENSPGCV